jgi:hypothetical protein
MDPTRELHQPICNKRRNRTHATILPRSVACHIWTPRARTVPPERLSIGARPQIFRGRNMPQIAPGKGPYVLLTVLSDQRVGGEQTTDAASDDDDGWPRRISSQSKMAQHGAPVALGWIFSRRFGSFRQRHSPPCVRHVPTISRGLSISSWGRCWPL